MSKNYWISDRDLDLLGSERLTREEFYAINRRIRKESISGTFIEREKFLEACFQTSLPGKEIKFLLEEIF